MPLGRLRYNSNLDLERVLIMYVGRIVSIAKTKDGRLAAMYRVSSRSFPNRKAQAMADKIAIIPKEGFEGDIHKNPYIAYNCLRLVKNYAVVTNGSHTDMVAEKLEAGMSPRDALISAMFGMDYEHDHLKTPRISAIVEKGSNEGFLGIIRHDALIVRPFTLKDGEAYYVATYEKNAPACHNHDDQFDAKDAADACQYILGRGVFADLEKPVTAVCAVETADGFEVSFCDK